MKKINIFLVVFIVIVSLIILVPTKTFAAEFNFSAKAEIPENQINKEVSYFDIQLDRSAKQTLHVDLQNDTNQDVVVDVEISSATTNVNGVVEYSPNDIKPAKSLLFNMEDYVKAPENIKVPANSSKVLNIDTTMPAKTFNGVMAGGITLKEHQNDESKVTSDQGKGVSIKNKFSYVIGLIMQENKKAVTPNVKLNNVKPAQINYRNVILGLLENDSATFINKVAIDATIKKIGSDKPIYSIAKDGLQIAPNSTFDFPIPLAGEELEPGKYLAEIDVYGNQDDSGSILRASAKNKEAYRDHWILTKEFTVEQKIAQALNSKDVTLKKEPNWWMYAVIALLSLLILIAGLLLFVLLNKQKKDKG